MDLDRLTFLPSDIYGSTSWASFVYRIDARTPIIPEVASFCQRSYSSYYHRFFSLHIAQSGNPPLGTPCLLNAGAHRKEHHARFRSFRHRGALRRVTFQLETSKPHLEHLPPMSHSRLDSRRSNYLDAVHSCRISLATSNQFTYFIQQGHSVYRIHVQQQKKLVYGHIKTYGTVKKSHHRRVKSHPSSSYTFPTSGGRKQKIIRL